MLESLVHEQNEFCTGAVNTRVPGLRHLPQRGFGSQPKVAATRLPWVLLKRVDNLEEVVANVVVMPQSLSAVYIHLIFSTKDRRPLMRDVSLRSELQSYLGGISKQLDCPPVIVGGTEDHIHLLARFGRTTTQADWVKELKRVSNLWLKEKGREYAHFEWQGGYATFSVSESNLAQVRRYIDGQEEHHQKLSFQDELRAFFRKHRVTFDERYVWD